MYPPISKTDHCRHWLNFDWVQSRKVRLSRIFYPFRAKFLKNNSYPGWNTVRSKHFTKQWKRYTSLLTAFVSRAKKKREATTGNTARRTERVIPEIISEKYRIVVPRMLESFLRSREELIFDIKSVKRLKKKNTYTHTNVLGLWPFLDCVAGAWKYLDEQRTGAWAGDTRAQLSLLRPLHSFFIRIYFMRLSRLKFAKF